MVKLKNPLSSLGASGSISKAISFVRRRKQNIAEKKPEVKDVQTTAQLSWRHMFLKCTALWNALSAAEQAQWESLARPLHMTGYAYWQSQCLRPNPGIYLPLQGGTMQGDIDMAKHRVLKLPLATDNQEPISLAYAKAYIFPYLHFQGARVFHTTSQSIPDATPTILAFNDEMYDSDAIHDKVVNNSRLTCKTAGEYVISATVAWEGNIAQKRRLSFKVNNSVYIAFTIGHVDDAEVFYMTITTINALALNDYVELEVFQNSTVALNVLALAQYTPYFAMGRIAP